MKNFKLLLSIPLVALAVTANAVEVNTNAHNVNSSGGGLIHFNGEIYDMPSNAEIRAFYDGLDTAVQDVISSKPQTSQMAELQAWAKNYNDGNFYSKISVTPMSDNKGVVNIYFP
ncbi:TPA: hypothetical protein ACJEU7_003029 [Acinetobacter baumannii]|uniref:hypothetical protein n=1 Tax=Acinetobacter baumannii TaxID=470 RepID=UPI002259185E|nr:hypothetical protein [Acinetobacter baumannii]MCX3035254.1 hypothetical protein [Acinetobacter baumannii]